QLSLHFQVAKAISQSVIFEGTYSRGRPKIHCLSAAARYMALSIKILEDSSGDLRVTSFGTSPPVPKGPLTI
ncbi:Hypothetical protein FKW44_015124, partial [Caligus rogercresseyi]